ncbi:hypothetical protein A2Y83_05555 [Candidatus Falkowbacteria bacterium RBG_13_39_14]|uniref:Uncharacterized protein n=1 Tax=Candidatus Falkowbacteria bacterium RBG_13_39_14 TaxID=1797985 RepID=A0A1F5S8B0_9BACT|nr:MAG: hypothetical protein A2Y83_05555 [Candidatus Falkowbacteria bacterium RBG_13_39_14]
MIKILCFSFCYICAAGFIRFAKTYPSTILIRVEEGFAYKNFVNLKLVFGICVLTMTTIPLIIIAGSFNQKNCYILIIMLLIGMFIAKINPLAFFVKKY